MHDCRRTDLVQNALKVCSKMDYNEMFIFVKNDLFLRGYFRI